MVYTGEGRTKKALVFLLDILVPAFMLLTPVRADKRSITVHTDEPDYYHGNKANITAILTYNGNPTQRVATVVVKWGTGTRDTQRDTRSHHHDVHSPRSVKVEDKKAVE